MALFSSRCRSVSFIPFCALSIIPSIKPRSRRQAEFFSATIPFIGKDTNALRKLSLLYQLGQYHRIGTIGWRGNYALHQPLPIGQHVLFVPVAILPAFAHPTSFRIDPWFATFEFILISLLLGLPFFGAQVLSVVCHFDEDTSIGSVRAIHNARIHNSPLVNTANPVLLELLIQLLNELVHNPQACQFSAKATDGAVVWSWKAYIQEEEFAQTEGTISGKGIRLWMRGK